MVTDAKSYFTNKALDLGQITGINGGKFTLDLKLTETTNAAGGFYGSFIVGDPPPSEPAAAAATDPHAADLAKALFDGFFGHSGASASTFAPHAASPAAMIAAAHDEPATSAHTAHA